MHMDMDIFMDIHT